jgi:addiction module HigA family antidote
MAHLLRLDDRGPDRVEIVNYHQANSEPHPGEVLLLEFIEPMGLTQNGLACAIGVPPRRINEIVLGKRSITADTDLRLARYFGVSEGFWRPPGRPRPAAAATGD